jgi:hypothetical protein
MTKKVSAKNALEVRERAVRIVFDHQGITPRNERQSA